MKAKREAAEKQPHRPQAPSEEELRAAEERRTLLGPPEIKASEVTKGTKLGTGSFGDVWRGTCRSMDVAIKILHRQEFDPKQLVVFKREVQVLSQIYHPNVCLFMGACFEQGQTMIVTELVGRGDLEKLLHNRDLELPLFLRIRMAIEAARGMTWLHFGEPAFVHRDVKLRPAFFQKPANFLVTEGWNIKITDFGLSQAAPQGVALKDGKEGARGTPLWMAPEVLEGREFTTSADVYSFGIVLWEILTRTEPFKQFRNYQKFKEAIVKQGVRPPIPPSCPPSLQSLMQQCWAADPAARPNFVGILAALEDVLVDVALDDPSANAFWKLYFPHRVDVPWREWWLAFLEHLGIELPPRRALPEVPTAEAIQRATKEMLQEFSERSTANYQRAYQEFLRRANSPADATVCDISAAEEEEEYEQQETRLAHALYEKCVASILGCADPKLATQSVNLEQFGKMLQWFGPINDEKSTDNFLERTRTLLSKSWFHGDIQAQESERLLDGRPHGTFLIRYSNKVPGTFTISKVQSDGRIAHQRIGRTPASGGYSLQDRPETYASLEELIERAGASLKLITCSPGSKYATLFVNDAHNTSGYIFN